MTSKYTITDGTIEVDLLPNYLNELMPRPGGLGPSKVSPDLDLTGVSGGYGGQVADTRFPPIFESYKLQLFGNNADDAAQKYQEFIRLLRKAGQFRNPKSRWQKEPVYLVAQWEGETNPRYSLVLGLSSWSFPDIYRPEMASGGTLLDLDFTIIREPIWRDVRPLGVPGRLTVAGAGSMAQTGLIPGGEGGSLSITRSKALEGYFSGRIFINGASSESYWEDNSMDSETTFVSEFIVGLSDLTMASGDSFYVQIAKTTGGSNIFTLTISYDGSDYKVQATANLDSGTDATAQYVISDGDIIKVVWAAATGVGNNDGELELFINGVSKEALSSLDNDTKDIDYVWTGATLGLDAGTTGWFYLDRIRWADADDGVWHRTHDFEGAELMPIGNQVDDMAPDTIFNYDDSAAAFSGNLIGLKDWEPFAVSGSTPATNDIIYIGGDSEFYNFLFYINNPDWTIEIEVEFSQGSGTWGTGPNFSDNPFNNGGYFSLGFSRNSTEWVADTVNGVSKHWIRIRVVGLSSIVTVPTIASIVPYYARDNYLHIKKGDLPGDIESLLMLRFYNQGSSMSNGVGWLAMGRKTRGLEYFNPSLYPGGGKTSPGFSITYGTDTSAVASSWVPGGYVARCTFSADANLVDRVLMELDQDSIKLAYEGAYRMYLKARLTAGSAGDVSFRGGVISHSVTLGKTVEGRAPTNVTELIDLGRFEIYPNQILGDEVAPVSDLKILVQALSSNGSTPSVDFLEIFLLPIDESACVASWQQLGNQLLLPDDGLIVDSGVLRYGANEFRFDDVEDPPGTVQNWSVYGLPMVLEPDKDTRLYFLLGGYDASNDLIVGSFGGVLLAETRIVSRWFNLRGAE